jgi:hypothetical protein
MVLEGRIVGDEEVVPTVIDQRRPVVIASAISRRRSATVSVRAQNRHR